jgi:hypothetical protein
MMPAGDVAACLFYDTYSCILVTDGPCERSRESLPAEPCSQALAACCGVAGSGRAVGPRLFHLSSTSLSVPPTSTATENTRCGRRGQTCIHRKTTTRPDATRTVVRICQRIVHQRGCQPGLIGAAAARGRSWLSRSWLNHAPCSWSIGSIDYWQRNWRRSINCWCPTSARRLAQPSAQQRRHTWR